MDKDAELQVLTSHFNIEIMRACAVFAREVMAIGHRDPAIESMAHALAIAEQMTENGEHDCTAGMMLAMDALEQDGIKEDVLARVSELRRRS